MSAPSEDLELLADAIEAFAGAQEIFNSEHKADYGSEACRAAYDRREEARKALDGELGDALRERPRDIAAALRQWVQG